eukprot:COSAG04_NODE_22867_length_348_cov_0.602410_1_plen_52_part_10
MDSSNVVDVHCNHTARGLRRNVRELSPATPTFTQKDFPAVTMVPFRSPDHTS